MPLIPNSAVLEVFATLPLATYPAGETVLAAGTTTGRLLILRRGAVTIEKEGTEIAEVTEPGAIFGELSALLNQPHTADVRTLEDSEFHVGRAELLKQDPTILLCVAAILAQRLNVANQALIKLRSEIQLHRIVGRTIGKAVKDIGRTAERIGLVIDLLRVRLSMLGFGACGQRGEASGVYQKPQRPPQLGGSSCASWRDTVGRH